MRAPGCAGLALINIADLHPLIVPRIRHYLTDELGLEPGAADWRGSAIGSAPGLRRWRSCSPSTAKAAASAHGDAPTIADIAVVTQVTPARTFGVDLAPYPRVVRVYDSGMAIPAFADAAPGKAARRGVALHYHCQERRTRQSNPVEMSR